MNSPDETARTVAELRQKLRRQGIAGSREVVLIEGLAGHEDACIASLDVGAKVMGVGFSTADITVDAAHQVIRELTVLERQRSKVIGSRTLTPYFAPK